ARGGAVTGRDVRIRRRPARRAPAPRVRRGHGRPHARRGRARGARGDEARRGRERSRRAGAAARRRQPARHRASRRRRAAAVRAVDAGRPGGSAMNRRRFLGFLAGTTAALATTRGASAQSRPAGRWAPSDVPPAAPVPRPTSLGLGGSALGVSATEVRIGMSGALKGTAGGLGTAPYRGAPAAYDGVNLRGGVYGRAITVVALDDNYEPNPCIKNTIQLLEKDPVFTLSNYVGTPTLTRALPVIKRYAEQQ